MAVSAQVVYRFNGFRVDPARRLMFGADGQPIPLKPKVFDTLLFLVERPGELVAKEVLLEAVWPHVVVEENNLNKAISTLRQVFGETRDEHRFIVTEPGRGYRFVARVETVPTVTSEAPPAGVEGAVPRDGQSKAKRRLLASAAIAAVCAVVAIGVYWLATAPTVAVDVVAPGPAPNSIAVLPFDNLSPDPDDAYFAAGLHEAILSQLANIGEIHVIARASVLGYDGTQKPVPVIARELNVETVLDGSVRYADGRVLVTVHLSDGAANSSLWSKSYDREFSNIFAIQSDIALSVARALEAKLLPAERERVARALTTSLPAYTLYLQAVARAQRGTWQEALLAVGELDQALKLDPNFAAARVLAANLRAAGPVLDPERAADHLAQAERAVQRALALDPELGAAHAALGSVLAAKKDWVGSEAAFREAVRRNASPVEISGYAALNSSVANFAYARELTEEARRVNPQDSNAVRALMATNALLGNWDVARAQYDSGKRLFAPWPDGDMVMMHLEVGDNDLARARAIRAAGSINAAMIASLDNPRAALRELHRLHEDPLVVADPGNRRDIGMWAGHFGDPTLALTAMLASTNEASMRTIYLWYPQLKEMRQLPEFKAFLREIGIVGYWQEYGWPDICRPLDGDDFACD
jgi:TolB-like protein/DNA-binding winged helix-turn-helix (wHTH) protein